MINVDSNKIFKHFPNPGQNKNKSTISIPSETNILFLITLHQSNILKKNYKNVPTLPALLSVLS